MKKIDELAFETLIKEVKLTPKPGLVDKNNNGSHSDMDLNLFFKSANAIKPFILKFFNCGKDSLHVSDEIVFDKLRIIGLECEEQMFKATNGVNTHKGMVFSFAVICGAIGKIKAKHERLECVQLQDEIKAICKGLIQKDLSGKKLKNTNGEKFFQKTKSAGIREEAQNGYPTIFQKSLIFYNEKKEKYTENIALKLTLLFIMTQAKDSNLYARGGLEGLSFAKTESKKILDLNDFSRLDEQLYELDKDFIAKNLSPGGSADLLCLTYFISNILSCRVDI